MKYLVTGGAGFIGSNFVHYMVKAHADAEILCVDALTYAGDYESLLDLAEEPRFRFAHCNICNREAIYALFRAEKPDVVVNFAAESHVDRSIETPEIFLQTNIIGTSVLMDACREYGISRYHQVSTDEVYGDLPLDRPDLFFTEETPLHTSSPYSSSKASADLLVLAYSRTERAEGRALADYVPLDTLLREADFIFLHCPLTPETEALINADRIAKMKDGVILVNNGRGQLIVEADLAAALASGKVAYAALDVVSTEPIKADNPLLHAPNCIITPHVSWATKEARERIMQTTADNVRSFIEGKPENVVN